MNKRYSIGCATDNNYAQHLGIMIYSLLSNTSTPQLFDFYIVNGGISKSNFNKFDLLKDRFKANFFYITPENSYFENLKIFETYGIATYYRFFLIDTIKLDRLLFLDCDMIVEGDIVEVFKTDLMGNIISAVHEVLAPKKHLNKFNLNVSFNAGMMLIDCIKWQKENISQKAIDYTKKNSHLLEYADQDSLNVVLKNYWHIQKDHSWNVIAKIKLAKFGIIKLDCSVYSKKEILKHFENPNIIHYANRLFKPWYWLDPAPYKKNYIKYKELSPWKKVPFPDKSLIGVIKRIIYYITFIFKYIKRNYLFS
jgi:lipopolysaccharide biosynthesis glycosyltransferase